MGGPTCEVIEGDALAVLPTFEAGRFDAVITDPPYFLPARHYYTRKEFPRSLSDLGILEHFFSSVFREAVRVLKPSGCLYVFCDGQSYPVMYACLYRHVRTLRPLVWDKQVSINGYSWRHQHELILFAELDEYPAVKTGDGDIIRTRAVPVEGREHPAEKPVDLLSLLIEKSAPPGGMVLDPFAGSGAAGEAARRVGRSAVLIEREAEYCTIARRRIAEVVSPLFASQTPTLFTDAEGE